jgi:streptogramin lyase
VDSYRNGKFRFEFKDAHTPESWLSEVVSSPGNPIILSSLSGWLFSRTNINGTNEWTTFPTPDFGGAQTPDFGRDPCEDSDGVVWYRMAGGRLARIIGGKIIRLDHPPGLRNPNVNSLRKDDAGRLWVGTDQELAVWDGNSFVDMTPTNGEPNLAVRDLAFCPDGSLWVRTDDKLRKCINRRWLAEATPWDGQFPPSIRALRMFGDSLGGVWVIHYGQGLWHIDRQGHVSRVGEPQGLPNGFVESWCEDREGNFWAGLRDGGLACIRPRIFHVVWPPEGWKNKSMRSICEDADGAMWFGVAGPTVLRWFDGAFAGLTPPTEWSPGTETAVLPDGPGRLWVGTVRNGLWLLENGVFKRPFPSGDINTVVRCLCRDRTGALWIGSEFGLSRWDQGGLKHFTLADGFSAAYVSSIAEDQAGDIWLGTAAGELRRWHLGKFESFYPPDSLIDPNFSPADVKADQTPLRGYSGALFGRERFWSLHFDDDGVLWIGTLGGGLLRFKDGHFTRFTTHEGLPNEHVSQILEDDFGQLWLGTRAGISRVNKRELTNFAKGGNEPINFITYGRSDGLPTIECSGGIQPACWKSRDGRLWFSTAEGPVWVNPSALQFNHLPPPVQLEEVLVDGNRVADNTDSSLRPGVHVPGQIRIPPGRHYFEFKFTALSFTSPDKVKFQWRLKGLETDWVAGGNRRAVSYSFLQAGNYRFEVRACNNDGVWNQTGASVSLTVLPYFWETWWFKMGVLSLGLLVCLGVLLTIYFIRIARWRALENLRLRIARDLHDEVGANLGSISLLAQMMEHTPTRTDATQVRGLAVQTMDTLRDIVWFIDPTHDRLSDLVIRMHETARTMLPAVEFKFDQTGDFDSTDLSLAFRRNVLPLFKETLHNLLRHSHATQVEISVCRSDKEFQFRVHDNGTGFDPKKKSGGNGLKNMKRRAAEIGGRIELESHSDGGTTVTLTAPVTQIRTWW